MTIFRIEPARPEHVPLILRMIRGLGEYEKLSHEVVATEEGLKRWLFGEKPVAEVLIGCAGEEPAGFALYFTNFSTFLGRPGIYLEDLFVDPVWRGQGLGKLFLARLAAITVERGYGRLEWMVLDWNESAIGFYEKLGARPMEEWTVFRLQGEALENLAKE